MIPQPHLTQWALVAPWPTQEQIEQDLLLDRALCAIADDSFLGSELAFRGGTALHKLHLPVAYRYSEDLDYVRTTAGGIGDVTGALLDLGRDLGFRVSSRVSMHPKVFWRTDSESGIPLRLKVRHPAAPEGPASRCA